MPSARNYPLFQRRIRYSSGVTNGSPDVASRGRGSRQRKKKRRMKRAGRKEGETRDRKKVKKIERERRKRRREGNERDVVLLAIKRRRSLFFGFCRARCCTSLRSFWVFPDLLSEFFLLAKSNHRVGVMLSISPRYTLREEKISVKIRNIVSR